MLASGSKGNVCYVKTKNHNILIDIGTNKKYIVEKLKNINILPEDIDIILISHLHKDHISALNTFVKIYKPTICITKKMFEEMDSINNYPFLYIYEDDIELEAIWLNSLAKISYKIWKNKEKARAMYTLCIQLGESLSPKNVSKKNGLLMHKEILRFSIKNLKHPRI